MSPLPVKMILKKEVVLNSVAEFLGCWAVGGKATLSLNTQPNLNSKPSPWYNLPLLDHQEEVHPETEEWFA